MKKDTLNAPLPVSPDPINMEKTYLFFNLSTSSFIFDISIN